MLGVFPSLDPSVFGGIEEAGRVAWDGIQKARGAKNCTLLCYSPNSHQPAPGAIELRTKPAAIATALRRRWDADTVLVWHLGLLQLVPFLRVGGAKRVVFLHGIEAWPRHGWGLRRLMKRVDLFLTNSDYTWERFVTVNPEFRQHPHRTVHLGLGTPLADPPKTDGAKPTALMIGRMEKKEDYKGHREMIAAWRLVTQRTPEAELWIVGGGNLQPELESLAAGAPVRFFGRVSDEKKQQILEQCRCLALPSRGEGFGLVYLEAMRNARPCLVSTEDAGREVVNPPEAGLAVNPGDPGEVAEAVSRLLGGAEWDGFSERARRRYESQFTAAGFQRRLVEALCL